MGLIRDAMTKPESRRGGTMLVAGRSAEAEEQLNNGPLDPNPSGGSEESMTAAMPKIRSAKIGLREGTPWKSAECEVYDDGTNTFFW